MQEEKHEGKELICANVDKVYDWIVKENTFEAFPLAAGVGIPFPMIPSAVTNPVVTCEVEPTTGLDASPPPIQILSREDRQFCIDGKNVCLQQLTIRKNFTVRLTITAAEGTFVSTQLLPISRTEVVTLCAPEGTDVEITYTELDCFVTSTGTIAINTGLNPPIVTFTNLVISVTTCQSIQSTYPVTIELLADFCEPREDFPTVCPAPSHPPQCPQVFPDDGYKAHHGHNRHCH